MKSSRFKEASTWASLSGAFAALSTVPVFAPYTVPAAAIVQPLVCSCAKRIANEIE